MWAEKFRKGFLPFLMVLSVFVQTGAAQNTFGVFDFYWYYPLYIWVFLKGLSRLAVYHKQARSIFLFISLLWMSSAIAYFINPYPLIAFGKQNLGWAFTLLTWWFFLKNEATHKRLSSFIEIYIGVAVVAAFLCLPEQLLHQVGVHLTPKKGGWLGLYRCYSICLEPFTLATLLVPAFLMLLYFRLHHKRKIPFYALLFLALGLLLTFSFAAWIALLLGLVAMSLSYVQTIGKWVLPFILLLGIGLGFYGGYRARIGEGLQLFSSYPSLPSASVLHASNSSSRAFFLNAVCATKQFYRYPLFGGGLGSHATAYQKHVEEPLSEKGIVIAHYNQVDAGSGFLRWLSEMGVVGLLLLFVWLKRAHKMLEWGLGIAFFSYLLSIGLHGGNYFHFGLQASIVLTGFLCHYKERPGFDKNP
jgi:hypothetical protein